MSYIEHRTARAWVGLVVQPAAWGIMQPESQRKDQTETFGELRNT